MVVTRPKTSCKFCCCCSNIICCVCKCCVPITESGVENEQKSSTANEIQVSPEDTIYEDVLDLPDVYVPDVQKDYQKK